MSTLSISDFKNNVIASQLTPAQKIDKLTELSILSFESSEIKSTKFGDLSSSSDPTKIDQSVTSNTPISFNPFSKDNLFSTDCSFNKDGPFSTDYLFGTHSSTSSSSITSSSSTTRSSSNPFGDPFINPFTYSSSHSSTNPFSNSSDNHFDNHFDNPSGIQKSPNIDIIPRKSSTLSHDSFVTFMQD